MREFLYRFLKKKEPKEQLPLIDVSNVIKSDMHSHLLPEVDDGPKTLDESIKMIEGLIALGYTNLICTPHVMHDFYRNSTNTILNSLEVLKKELIKRSININIQASAEYYFDEELKNRVASKDILTFGKEKYLLFELSYFNEHQGIFEGVSDIVQAGYTPVLAHPERYPYYVMNLKQFDQLKGMGLKFQINLLSLAGYYGDSAIHGANYLIDRGFVEFVGTDIHRKSHLPVLRKALRSEKLHQLVNSGNLLNNSLFD